MRKLQWLEWGLLLLMLACLISLSILAEHAILGTFAAILLLIWFFMTRFANRKKMEPQANESVSKFNAGLTPEEETIRLLSLYRHEWMNDIQLLLAYTKLKKYDKLHEFAENMKEKAIKEGTLFKIGDPKLALFLYSSYVERNNMELELQMEPELRLDQAVAEPQRTGELLIDTVKLFQKAANQYADNKLLLRIQMEQMNQVDYANEPQHTADADSTIPIEQAQLLEGSSLTVAFEFTGEYDQALVQETMQDWNIPSGDYATIAEQIFEERRAALMLRFPLKVPAA